MYWHSETGNGFGWKIVRMQIGRTNEIVVASQVKYGVRTSIRYALDDTAKVVTPIVVVPAVIGATAAIAVGGVVFTLFGSGMAEAGVIIEGVAAVEAFGVCGAAFLFALTKR